MTALFRKLNLGEHPEVVVVDPPASFEGELEGLAGVKVRRGATGKGAIGFAIAFVKTLAEVEKAAAAVLPKATEDATIWFAYPKGSSKRFKCEFNRDTGWTAVRAMGFDSVRQVAIDEDWSALRFRRAAFIGK